MERQKNTLSKERKINRNLSLLMKTLYRQKDGFWRAEYLKRNKVFHFFGENCYYEPNVIPPDASLISIHNNVRIAYGVSFITHDIFHQMFRSNIEYKKYGEYTVHFDTIEIFDNVCIGGNVTIMPGVKIGPNAIIAASSVITKDVPEGVIVGGNPAKVIGSVDDLAKRRANVKEPQWNSSREVFKEFYWK